MHALGGRYPVAHGRVNALPIARIEVSAPVAFVLPNATGRSCRLMHSRSQVEASLVDTSLVNTPLGMGFSVFVISLVV